MIRNGRELVFSRWKFALVAMPFLLFLNAVSFTLVFGHEDDALALGKRLGTVFFLYLLTIVLLVVGLHFARDAWLERKLRLRWEARGRSLSASGIPPRKVVAYVVAFVLGTSWLLVGMIMAISAITPGRLDNGERVLWLLLTVAAALAAILVKLAGDSTAARERRRRVRSRLTARGHRGERRFAGRP